MAMNLAEINEKMKSLKDWAIDNNALTKDFEFGSFKEALDFVNKVGEISERLGHHPDILISYNIVRLTLITYSEKSLSEKDFESAEEIDKL